MNKLTDPTLIEIFDSYPKVFRENLLKLRQLILNTAQKTKNVGKLEEVIRWGEPSFITSETRSGSTIRIAWHKSKPMQYGIFFNCNTTLVATFKEKYGDLFKYEGNRYIFFYENDRIPRKELSECIALALTYHLSTRF